MRIYVASSWRNAHQPIVVDALRVEGHEVYDFRNPPAATAFRWEDVSSRYRAWTPYHFTLALERADVRAGFRSDMDALRECDACVLVLPSGRSSHLELGWAAGAGKITIIYMPEHEPFEPELMYLMADSVTTTLSGVVSCLWYHGRRRGLVVP